MGMLARIHVAEESARRLERWKGWEAAQAFLEEAFPLPGESSVDAIDTGEPERRTSPEAFLDLAEAEFLAATRRKGLGAKLFTPDAGDEEALNRLVNEVDQHDLMIGRPTGAHLRQEPVVAVQVAQSLKVEADIKDRQRVPETPIGATAGQTGLDREAIQIRVAVRSGNTGSPESGAKRLGPCAVSVYRPGGFQGSGIFI